MREERVVLEDGVDVAVERRALRDVLAEELDRSVGGLLEARDEPQHGGLARAGRTQHREELARRDLEIDVVDRRDRAEFLGEPGEPDGRLLVGH